MILQSARDMDTVFVSKAIQEHKLEAAPVTGFNADPNYWMETQRWRRVVERYLWGSVIFMADRTRARAATIIAIGRLDLEKGRVTTQGGQQQINVSWYQEMAMELKSASSADSLAIPPCLGFRKADHICDGGLNRETRKLEPACAWRGRCIALQEHAVTSSRLQETILQGKSPSQIVQLTTRLLERKGTIIVGETPSAPTPKPAKPKAVAASQPSAAALASGDPAAFRSSLISNVSTVMKQVAEAAGLKVSMDEGKQNALPGELYLINRATPSGYISLYKAARDPGEDALALASFRIRHRKGGYNVQLALDKESRLFDGIVESDVKPFKDGKFLTIVNGCPPEGRRMDHIKRILTAMLNP